MVVAIEVVMVVLAVDPGGSSGGLGGDGRAPTSMTQSRVRGILGCFLNLSSSTPATNPLIGMRPGKQGIFVNITHGGGSVERPIVVQVSAKHVTIGYGGDNATRAETWTDARCGGDVTPAGSDDDSDVPGRRRRTRRSPS